MTSRLEWQLALSQITWIFLYRLSLCRSSSRCLRNKAPLRPCLGAASVTNTGPVRQGIEPERGRFWFVPGVSLVRLEDGPRPAVDQVAAMEPAADGLPAGVDAFPVAEQQRQQRAGPATAE